MLSGWGLVALMVGHVGQGYCWGLREWAREEVTASRVPARGRARWLLGNCAYARLHGHARPSAPVSLPHPRFETRRNTALLCLGDLLFVASSSPSFMMAATSAPPPPPPAASPALGAMEAAGAAADVHVEDGEVAARPLGPGVCAAAWSCDFQLEVSAVDLGALVARCGGGGGGGGGSAAASAGEVGPVVFDGVAPAAAGAAGAGSGAPARGQRPVVVRTVSRKPRLAPPAYAVVDALRRCLQTASCCSVATLAPN